MIVLSHVSRDKLSLLRDREPAACYVELNCCDTESRPDVFSSSEMR